MDFKDPLLRADAAYIDRMLKDGVLVPMSPSAFPAEEGTLLIMCSDGDQHQNLMLRHWAQSDGRPCHHPLALNGLPLMVAPTAIACDGESSIVCKHALQACELKKLKTVVVYGHWPCGVGHSLNLPIWEHLKLYCEGKESLRAYLKERGHQPEVLCGLHIHHGYGRKKFKELYHFHRSTWIEWQSSVGIEFISEHAAAKERAA